MGCARAQVKGAAAPAHAGVGLGDDGDHRLGCGALCRVELRRTRGPDARRQRDAGATPGQAHPQYKGVPEYLSRYGIR